VTQRRDACVGITFMTPRPTAALLTIVLFLSIHTDAATRTVRVKDDASLAAALQDARPGDRIRLAPGKYRPGVSATALAGTAENPIEIEAADARNKPLFEGGALAIHLRGCSFVTLRNLAVRGQTGNGVNVDDGGRPDSSRGILLDGLHVSDIGPRGNRDAIKLSGLDEFVVRDCLVEGWAGEGVDMVGCHDGLIERCTFRGKDGFGQTIAVQAKGGSSGIVIRGCNFLNPGQRAINIGGSTGMPFFRPKGANYEAKEVIVEHCRFVGGASPINFVGVDGAIVRYNTIYHPDKWVVRILQETREAGFVPSRNGRFERNVIVFQRAKVRTHVNESDMTDPKSFLFKDNLWYCDDAPAQSRPTLPSPEQGGVYDTDPNVELKNGLPFSALKGFGADGEPVP
jgi:hypothetical protein